MLKTENGLIIRMCKVLMRGKMMGVNFEFNFEELDNNELRINGRRADFLSFRQWRSIIIKKRVDNLDNNHIEKSYLVGL